MVVHYMPIQAPVIQEPYVRGRQGIHYGILTELLVHWIPEFGQALNLLNHVHYMISD